MLTSTRPTPEQEAVLAAYRTCEFATVSRHGTPIAWPLVTWQQPDGSLVVTTSIGVPQKAINIRRTPEVAMLFSDPTGSGLTDPPQILVQGTASCPEEIVTDVNRLPEYWTQLMRRQPSGKAMSSVIGRRVMDFYYLRLIITVTPTAVTTRPGLRTESPLQATVLPRSARAMPVGQVAARLPDYRSGVLAAFDDAGRPTLLRVRPTVDGAGSAVVMQVPDDVDLRPGPASMLCHSHDDQVSAQNSFVVAGTLQRRDDRWALSTDRFIPGPGTGGPLAVLKAVRQLRSTAARYLQRRGLERPAVEWAAIDALWRKAESGA
jgi:hypothetical protein